ncbi:MAG TPA: molybdopterin cofactor-binding domain-containing protein, partial [Chitinophagaceae bacterium]|nr:molybdopterin cofactor-binding domain-containing protein [Chitinophagaceae bacterium]
MHHSRRNFIKTAGCLTIGFCLGGTGSSAPLLQELPPGLQEYPGINAWLEILADGRVRVLTGKLELGQGIRTAVAQVAAEELDMDMWQVEVVLAETGRTPNEGYTAGSGSIESSAMSIRHAAAAARQKLLELAAQKMNVPVSELSMANGKIGREKSNRMLSFGEVLDGRQLTDEVRSPVSLKPKDKYRLVGKAVPREDIRLMVSGQPVYVQDLRFAGMVHARVVRPPAYGAQLLQYDEQAARKKVPALIKTVVNGSFLAVIAADEYQAVQAQQLLREHSTWSDGPSLPKVSGEKLAAYLTTLPVQTKRLTEKGSVAALAGNTTIKARYFKPYIMHGSIGPSCAVALYSKDMLHVWTHSQGVYPLRDTLAALLHLPAEKIHVKGVPGSGCYGHNGADDVAADAALLALAYPDSHVRVQWSREDEHAWEPYGSAMIMETEALLDAAGKISHWKYALWSDTHGTRPGGNAENLLAARYLAKPFTEQPSGYSGGAYRNAEPYYSIPNQQAEVHFFRGPLRVSSLRGLGAYANIFAIESFMDELAEKAGKDAYTFRLLHLEDERAKDVIRTLQSLTEEQAMPHTGMSMAFSRYKNSGAYCAVAARVAVNPKTGEAQVQKMWAVIDAGEVINLDGIKNQVEGGMIQSASWTLQEQVLFDEKHIS